jgi:hypothetical protein
MANQVPVLEEFRKELLQCWTDSRSITKEMVDVWVWWHQHAWADFNESGFSLSGYSFREKHGDWLLVLKVIQDDIPQVGFVTSSDPTHCMSKLRKLLRNGGLTLYPDRYA